MDLRKYFKRLQEVEAELSEEYPTVVSLETADGGKPGLISEASRANAAKLIVEGRAVLATEEQRRGYMEKKIAAKKAAEALDAARRVQVAIISEAEFQQMPGRKQSHK